MANFPQGAIPYDGYPAPGAEAVKNQWAGDFFGSNNYQIGGYNLNASSLGMLRIETAGFSALSQSGNYFAKAIYPAISGNNENRAPTFPYVTVKWYYAANSVEVANNTNLSAEVAQLRAYGL
jgi:hypothetical protein